MKLALWQLNILALKEIAIIKKVTNTDIAKKTGILRHNVTRFFRAKSIPKLDTYLKIVEAIDKDLLNIYKPLEEKPAR